ncbi:zf-HC2 domain-containing protein [Actinacidiphila bryophytorum]|uniref:Zinc-finger n=1 Tax=Actinacidiphila bryophytorum TaxID=1436133 RepID=A0A9W4E0U7_9ACTN|nr:zf-HC2 domain-containing protein [Actinacidiphila bryophytorum]CAG7604049.1 Putative zinc-finger [Actinacidiphila bryophytorum]
MSTSGSGEQRAHRIAPAEQHLGDRLAAFVDGELADDARDRVQAHLATCAQCKAAATEQRRLKSVVASTELPAISAGLLARLQGLAACGSKDGDDGPFDGRGALDGHDVHEVPQGDRRGPFDGGLLDSGVFGSGGRRQMSYLTPARDLLAPGDGRGARGFRIHEMARTLTGAEPVAPGPLDGPADPRGGATAARAAAQASRGRRFAFAAAGAFSMAAIALGGALPMEAGVDGSAHPDDGPAVTPFSAADSVSDTHGTTPRDLLDAREERRLRQVSVPLPGSLASAASVASVTSVALAGAQATPGALPAGAFDTSRPPVLNGSADSSAALH